MYRDLVGQHERWVILLEARASSSYSFLCGETRSSQLSVSRPTVAKSNDQFTSNGLEATERCAAAAAAARGMLRLPRSRRTISAVDVDARRSAAASSGSQAPSPISRQRGTTLQPPPAAELLSCCSRQRRGMRQDTGQRRCRQRLRKRSPSWPHCDVPVARKRCT